MRLARVFPRRTNATPTDCDAYVGGPHLMMPHYDEVHISVAFSWDVTEARRLADEWSRIAPVSLGGPAMASPSGDFVPGRYVRNGYVITSRGCPNRCWFCDVWKREGGIAELPIRDGWNVLDSNLLACSEKHVRAVFAMLARQKRKPVFSGGLEARILKPWHAEALYKLRPAQMFFAYDTPDDYEPLVEAGRTLAAAGFVGSASRPNNALRCFVLIGYPRDSIPDAESRLRNTVRAGFMPMAMLWRGKTEHKQSTEWKRLQRVWARPALTQALARDVLLGPDAAVTVPQQAPLFAAGGAA